MYITIVAMLPWVIRSAASASVPVTSAVRGAVRRSSSQPAVTASGTSSAQRPSNSTTGSSAGRTPSPNAHSSSPPSSPASATATSKRGGLRGRTAMDPSNTVRAASA
ncbi:hypothetical protein SALBM217S_02924 [Streptomyces griseoloalbus]